MLLCERDRRLLSIMVGKHGRTHQLIPRLSKDLRNLSKRHERLIHRVLEALQLDGDNLTKLLTPRIGVSVLLRNLTKHLSVGAEEGALLPQQTRIDGRAVHTGSEEHPLAMINEVLRKYLEGLL